MKKKYGHMFIKIDEQQKDEEKVVINKLENDEISVENFDAQITNIRGKIQRSRKKYDKRKIPKLRNHGKRSKR